MVYKNMCSYATYPMLGFTSGLNIGLDIQREKELIPNIFISIS